MRKRKVIGLWVFAIASIMIFNISLFAHELPSRPEDGEEGKPTCTGSLCDNANGNTYNSSKTTCCGTSATYKGRKTS